MHSRQVPLHLVPLHNYLEHPEICKSCNSSFFFLQFHALEKMDSGLIEDDRLENSLSFSLTHVVLQLADGQLVIMFENISFTQVITQR